MAAEKNREKNPQLVQLHTQDVSQLKGLKDATAENTIQHLHATFVTTAMGTTLMDCLCSRIPGIHQWFLPQLHGFLPDLGTSYI